MTIRKVQRRGQCRLVIDILFRRPDGSEGRYRRDAQIQLMEAARAEERRLLVELARTGDIGAKPNPPEPLAPEATYTWTDAVRHFRAVAMPKLKATTKFGYDEMLDSSNFSGWESLKLNAIDLSFISAWDTRIVKTGVGASRRRNFHCVLRSVLKAAKEGGLVARLPELPKLPRVGRTVLQMPSPEDVQAILNEQKGTTSDLRWKSRQAAKLAFALAIFAGLRAGETRGLRWSDVNLKTGTITVRRTLSRGETAAPKSGHQRQIPIAGTLLVMLTEANESKPSPWAPVAPRSDGAVWGESGLVQALERTCKRLGIPKHRYHALRHFFVTSLFRGGVPAHDVQRLAGHAALGTTAGYAHHTAQGLRDAIAVLDRGNGVETAPRAQNQDVE